MTNLEWLEKLSELAGRDEPCVLITVLEAKGSTPREAGVKMLATAHAQFGTIGGGNLEFQAVAEARKLLGRSRPKTSVCHYPLGPRLAQCCGGAVTIFLEPFISKTKTVCLFGAGHVGKEVAKVLETLPVRVKWVDPRENEFPAQAAGNVEKIVAPDPAELVAKAPESSFIVVMTHSHDMDYSIVKAALAKGGFSYVGVIGSETKRVKFKKRLETEGISSDKMICPIGIDGIDGKHPREIAIAVAAELLTLGLTGSAAKNETGNVDCNGKACGSCTA